MVIKKKDFQKRILSLIDEAYKASSNSASYMGFHRENEHIKVEFRFRVQYDNYLSFNGFSVCFRSLEKNFITLLNNELSHLYEENMVFTSKKFYPLTYKFNFREIKTELDEYIAEFVKCLEYHEKEVFPKLLDIRFLAEYVGSVPFDKQSEIPVGGKYPVGEFKKLAILKWGNQTERYKEYKDGISKFIEEDFSNPRYKEEAPLYKKSFESLISHLENEPNPFL
ncbi:hypothetical protein [Ornithobacterium rhinotracheale]|uniref:hypothetical protein n=1 Tax=Ornithobacterium rhinotracheale TaxID=28251 RepID=UPI004035855D